MSDSPSPGLDLEGLASFLRDRSVSTAGPLRSALVGGGKSNLTFLIHDDEHRWVLRRPPLGHVERGAHDVLREHLVMTALATSTVPVPRTVALCREPGYIGSEFYLMEEVAGDVLRDRDQVEALTVADRAAVGNALVDTLAALHDVHPADVGLEAFGRPTGYLERQLDRWQRQYHAVTTRDRGLVDLVVGALRATLPPQSRPTIVHGDFRVDNVMIDHTDRGRIVAVLDWEMATLGDPLADLATLVMFWDEVGSPYNPITRGLTAFPGFATKLDVVERYAERRDVDMTYLDWYVCFSELKLAVILEQIHVRHVTGHTLGDGFGGIDLMVDALLATASARSSDLHRRADPA